MKVKLKSRHRCGMDPGNWKDSILTLCVVGDREDVKNLEAAIKEALADTARLSNYGKFTRTMRDDTAVVEEES